MSVLLIAEHNNKELRPFTLNAITAASQIDVDLHVLLIGNNCEDVAKSLSEMKIVKKVLHAEAAYYENYLAENFAPVIVKIAENYSHIVSSANTFGKNLMPRIAALLDTSQVSDIIKVISSDTFLRPIYAGNAFATVKSTDTKKCITIRPTSFEPCETSGGGSAPIEKVEAAEEFTSSKFIKREEVKSDRPELGTARVVISGGRGMQSGDNFKLINAIADKLNAAIGASRAAVDAGYISNEHQVGQTGKVVVPDLYIAVGISGAIQHLAGMKESKIIVAINKDGEAPIFSVADYGLEADLFEALPQFLEELNKLNTIQK
jgi:electron transfer flavoprotein alpha subunit